LFIIVKDHLYLIKGVKAFGLDTLNLFLTLFHNYAIHTSNF